MNCTGMLLLLGYMLFCVWSILSYFFSVKEIFINPTFAGNKGPRYFIFALVPSPVLHASWCDIVFYASQSQL
jgi:hypothetical protein